MSRLRIGRIGTHEVREFELDDVPHPGPPCGVQLQQQLLPLDRQEADRHVAVERLDVGPALHAVLVGQRLVHHQIVVQLVIIDLPVLKREDVHRSGDIAQYLVPLAAVLFDRKGLVARHHLIGLDAVDVG